MKFRWLPAFLASLFLAVPALAEVDPAVEEKIRKTLLNPAMGLQVESVESSAVPGLYRVQFQNGPVVYATDDGGYFIIGDLYQVRAGEYVNLAEQRRETERATALAAVKKEDMIIFSPAGETRAYVNVFTDVTCFYCQKLHKEVPELNRRGVEVRYLAYPRSGVGSDGYQQLVSAWCAQDPQETLTKLKNKEKVQNISCKDNPIAEQYELGQQLGVRGTPAMVTASGLMIPGYQSADELMITLGLE